MNENAFSYTYSATCNQEVLNIRKKYLPHEETKLEELKRLDSLVQNSGVMESLCAGIGGCLVFWAWAVPCDGSDRPNDLAGCDPGPCGYSWDGRSLPCLPEVL